jgi:hypothetical protein
VLLHQQHLPGALDRTVKAALIMGRQAGVLTGKNAAMVGHELFQQIDVFEIQRVDREVDFGLRTRSAFLHRGRTRSTTSRFGGVGPARHTLT